MLLERVQPSTLAEIEDGDEVVTVAGRLNRRLAIPAPLGLPRLREQADAWEEQLFKDAEELTHALPRQVLDAAAAPVAPPPTPQPAMTSTAHQNVRKPGNPPAWWEEQRSSGWSEPAASAADGSPLHVVR